MCPVATEHARTFDLVHHPVPFLLHHYNGHMLSRIGILAILVNLPSLKFFLKFRYDKARVDVRE